eukprot:TRINITY_DN9162_c0_g1_i1.p1 TRINITY_DN9162_c0_g1~~TRINITY_DN9162_c0_g1_i1.p1  ORF type:complete len:351 (+),score=56.86 TRINITY_DN9162_c0_g1_i1:1-1053(+)
MTSEDALPPTVNFRRPNVTSVLRDLDDFVFFVSSTNELVSLEDISFRPISGSGLVVSLEDGSTFPVTLPEIEEWFVEFGVSREECAIWVKTPVASYRLKTSHSSYVSYFQGLSNRFNITAEIFFLLYQNPQANYNTVVTKLCGPPHNLEESDIIAEASFILHHLKSHPDTSQTPFVIGLELKHVSQTETLPQMEVADIDDTAIMGGCRTRSSTALASSDRALTRSFDKAKDSGSLRTSQEFALLLLKNIPRIYLNDKGRLECYICQITFPKVEINEFRSHLHKHRTNMVCVFSEKERMSLRYLSFLNQLRVRSFIENELAETTELSDELASQAIQKKGPPKKRRRTGEYL